VAITMCGMAVVVDQKWLWLGGLVFGLFGAIGLAIGIANLLA
jgi:hypothetical protein